MIAEGPQVGTQHYQLTAGTYAIKVVGKSGTATVDVSLTVSGDIVRE